MALDGVLISKDDGYLLCQVHYFSEEMQKLLREELVGICKGLDAVASMRAINSYEAVLRELVKRIQLKPENSQKGIIGELLVHLVVRREFPSRRVASVLFNQEDRGLKKGFDLTLTDDDLDVWFTEVKSGELSGNTQHVSKMRALLQAARNDLIKKLDSEENYALWDNAISHAERALSSTDDKKDAIVKILDGLYSKSQDKIFDHTLANAVLAAVLFDPETGALEKEEVSKSYEKHKDGDEFANLLVIVVQKAAHDTVIDYLNREVASCRS